MKTLLAFQFPSNGKAYPKQIEVSQDAIENGFQFPSNGKAYPKINITDESVVKIEKRFNSLQTGKRIQS